MCTIVKFGYLHILAFPTVGVTFKESESSNDQFGSLTETIYKVPQAIRIASQRISGPIVKISSLEDVLNQFLPCGFFRMEIARPRRFRRQLDEDLSSRLVWLATGKTSGRRSPDVTSLGICLDGQIDVMELPSEQ